MNYFLRITWNKIRYCLGLFLLCLILTCAFSVQAQSHSNKRVLFISSYSYDSIAVANQIGGIQSVLGTDYEINYAFMDVQHSNSAAAEQAFYKQMQFFKNTHRNFDAVILGDDDALNFARKYRSEFFAGLPLVYEGVNNENNALMAYDEGMTGVIETLPVRGTIESAKKVMPKATRIFAIIDDSPTGQGVLKQFMAQQENFPELGFSYVDTATYTARELADKMASFGDDTILVFIVVTKDKDGNHYTNEQSAKMITDNANIPIFALSDVSLGRGIVGGKIVSTRDMGYRAALIVKRIFEEGISPAVIPPETMTGSDIFDKKVMDRFKISKRQVPDQATFINDEENFFSKHKEITIPIGVVFLILLLWLVREIRNNHRRQRMYAALVASSAMMSIALQQTGLHLWEYFPEKKAMRLDKKFNPDLDTLEWLENYPEQWIKDEYVHPADASTLMAVVTQINEGKKEASCDVRIKYADGQWHWERLRFVSIYDDAGKRLEVIGTAEKIEAYKLLEERFLVSMQQTGLVAWVYDFASASVSSQWSYDGIIDDVPKIDLPESAIDRGLIHPDDVDSFRHFYERLFAGEKSVEVICRWRTGNQVYRWLRLMYTNVFDVNHKPIKAFGTSIDVTEQKRSEERIALELSRSAALEGETLATAYFDLDTAQVFEWTHEHKSFATEGMTAGEGISDEASYIPVADERERFKQHLNRDYLRDQYEQGNHRITIEYRRYTSKRELLWARTYIYLSRHYETGHLVAYAYTRDINQVKIGQLALDSILQEEVEYVCVIDISKHEEYIVKTCPESDLLDGQTYPYEYQAGLIENHVVAEDRAIVHTGFNLADMTDRLDRGEQCTVYYREPDSCGEIRRKRTNVYYLNAEKTYLVYVRRDITQMYEEEQLQQEQLKTALHKAEMANRAKSDFLSRMSHEIRTPMNAIIGLATLISGHTDDAVYVSDNINKVNMSAHFLLDLINDILDISRIESGRMELNKVNVHFQRFLVSIDTLINSRAEEKHVIYESHIQGAPAIAYQFDEVKLRQVLINVLANAIKFTSAGGHVDFTAEKYGSEEHADLLRFTISDTGIGIAPEFVPKVFEAFAQEYSSNTTLYGGTGLGLAISRNLVTLMGGDIRVTSTKGKGTTFIVEVALPVVAAESIPELEKMSNKINQELAHYDFSGKRVLLVEDNEINREIAQMILEQGGLQVDTAVDGQAALLAYAGHECGYYAAILMDVRMPVMDGLETTRRIRASQKEDAATIPILAMTANAFEEDVKKSLAAGMNDHLTKPIDPNVLFRRLSVFLS